MQRFFLESPYLLLPCCAVAAYILLVIHLRRRTQRTKRVLLAGLAICLTLPVVQWLVRTPRERIAAVCRAVIDAVEARNPAGIDIHVARTFRVREIDRNTFMDAVERTLRHYSVENARLILDEVMVTDAKAVARFRVTGRFIAPEGMDSGGVIPWTVDFVEEDGVWKIQAADPRPTPFLQVSRLEELLR